MKLLSAMKPGGRLTYIEKGGRFQMLPTSPSTPCHDDQPPICDMLPLRPAPSRENGETQEFGTSLVGCMPRFLSVTQSHNPPDSRSTPSSCTLHAGSRNVGLLLFLLPLKCSANLAHSPHPITRRDHHSPDQHPRGERWESGFGYRSLPPH